jgi:hypothetical protein
VFAGWAAEGAGGHVGEGERRPVAGAGADTGGDGALRDGEGEGEDGSDGDGDDCWIESTVKGILAGTLSLWGVAAVGGVSRNVGGAGGPDVGDASVTCSMDDGGVAKPDRDSGERLSSSATSWSRSSSSSLRRRLGLLAGGDNVSGVEMAGVGKSAAGTAATAAVLAEDGDDDGAGSSHAAVAARPRLRRRRRRRRRLPAALSVAAGEGAGMLHETV